MHIINNKNHPLRTLMIITLNDKYFRQRDTFKFRFFISPDLQLRPSRYSHYNLKIYSAFARIMETLLENNREKVLLVLEKTEEDFVKDVTTFKNWIKTQTHLPEVPSDRLIENFLITNKFSIDKTKAKLDMYYTIRTLLPEYFKNKKPSQTHMKEISQIVYYFPMPQLTDELYRVNITKITGDTKLFNVCNFFAHQLNVNEIRLQEEINLGDVLIVDLKEISLGHLLKITPAHLMKATSILEKVFSNRIKQIHLINVPTFVDKLVFVLKSVIKKKIFERIHVHKNSTTLSKYVSVDILPKDYGGNQASLDTFKELWSLKLQEYSDRFDNLDSMKVSECLRPTLHKNDDVMGHYGNFRTLNFD